jgi:hypothetical protein
MNRKQKRIFIMKVRNFRNTKKTIKTPLAASGLKNGHSEGTYREGLRK